MHLGQIWLMKIYWNSLSFPGWIPVFLLSSSSYSSFLSRGLENPLSIRQCSVAFFFLSSSLSPFGCSPATITGGVDHRSSAPPSAHRRQIFAQRKSRLVVLPAFPSNPSTCRIPATLGPSIYRRCRYNPCARPPSWRCPPISQNRSLFCRLKLHFPIVTLFPLPSPFERKPLLLTTSVSQALIKSQLFPSTLQCSLNHPTTLVSPLDRLHLLSFNIFWPLTLT